MSAEIVRAVRVMDGRNRQRFAEDGQLLGSWISASTVRGTPTAGHGAGRRYAGGRGGKARSVRRAGSRRCMDA
jgi:hypothetical protein